MALQVIGTGLGRTGTLSLKSALEQLGFGRCHHMLEVFAQPERIPLWVEAGAGRPDWAAIFEGFQSSCDYPSCKFWRELMDAYPEAKLIHTLRDPEQWFESTQATIFAPRQPGAEPPEAVRPFFDMVMSDFGGRQNQRDFMIDYFQRHTDAVLTTVPAERLLVLDVGEGWAPLCRFLGVPVPETPFPRQNSRDAFQARRADHGEGALDVNKVRAELAQNSGAG